MFIDLNRIINEEINRFILCEGINPRAVELYNWIRDGKSVDCYGNVAFTNPKIMNDVWVIHFTDNGDDIMSSGGFTFGSNDFVDLANTADGRDYPEIKESGFDFAFLLSKPSELYARCDDAFIFKASGILCYHNGEKIRNSKPMQQFIFWCDDSDFSQFYRITKKRNRWNGKVYTDYYVLKNGNETMTHPHKEYGFDVSSFESMRDAISFVINDINGVNKNAVKRLRMQRDCD